MTVQGSVNTTPTPKLLVPCAGHLMTQCFIAFHDCPCIPTSFELDKTVRIVDEARTKTHSCPIFWLRGWCPELPVVNDPFVRIYIMGGHVFTDGSGGAETKDPRLRRCGHGVAWFLWNQSVARAELLVVQVFIWTDCLFVVNSFARGRRRKHFTHADLWEEFWRAHDAIGIPVLLQKVWGSHATEAEIAAGLISPLEAYGNEAADKLAARGALRNALSMEYVAATRNTDNRVRLVQTRLIEINLMHVQ